MDGCGPKGIMKISRHRLVAGTLTVALTAAVVALAMSRKFFTEAMLSAFFAAGPLSVVFLLFAVAPWKDAIPVLACTAVLAVIEFGVLHFPHGASIVVPLLTLAGMSSVLVLGIRSFWSTGELRKWRLWAFVPAASFVVSQWCAATLLDITIKLHPKAFDMYLYLFDVSLGPQFSFIIGKWFLQFGWLRQTCLLFYIALPLTLAAAVAGHLRARSSRVYSVMLGLLILGPLGIFFYNLLPANGPRYLFEFLLPNHPRAFPLNPLPMSLAIRFEPDAMPIPGFRNAIPSLHMAWALMAWWYSRSLGLGTRLFTLVFVAFTFLATLGTGEHYFIDLVVAVPFALMVEAAVEYKIPLRDPRRLHALLGGLMITLVWMALLSFCYRLWWISPAVPWACILATLATSFYLQRKLTPPVEPARVLVAANGTLAVPKAATEIITAAP
jgi:hypothetical protein